ncbi:MAG: hypothetical protein HC822_16155 [Oscillochloris sp.]|nr:hypothetical protein [Oscillochloris sp.]
MSTLQQYRLALQIFQANRLRRDYNDLALMPQYESVGEFFFTEMYGPRDFSRRDEQARRMQQFLHIVPGVRWNDIEQVLDLLDLTYRLDEHLAQLMVAAKTGTDFDEATYEHWYRSADNYKQRRHQLELINSSLYNVYRLSRSQLLGIALHRSGLIARLAGIEAVHSFLRKGYDAVRSVENIDFFAVTIYNRELARLDRIFEQ